MAVTAQAASELQERGSRARVGMIILIIGDAMLAGAVVASALYLKALNVLGQYHPAGEQAPSILLGLVLAAVMVGAREMYWWAGVRFRGGDDAGFSRSLIIALALVGLAFIGQVVVLATLGFAAPIHAFGSMTALVQGYHALHLLIAALTGAMVLARFRNGRLKDGHQYLVDVVGYWWVYVAVLAVLFWLVSWLTAG